MAPLLWAAPLVPEGKINTTDPDSGVMIQKGQPPMQGYNAQAAVTTNQIIVAAEVTTTPPDFAKLGPVLDAALRDLDLAGVTEPPTTVLADAGYWHSAQMQRIMADGIQVLVPPDSGLRQGAFKAGIGHSAMGVNKATTDLKRLVDAHTVSLLSSGQLTRSRRRWGL